MGCRLRGMLLSPTTEVQYTFLTYRSLRLQAMDKSNKSKRELELERQIKDLQDQNETLKDCIHVQQKTIEVQRKEKQFYQDHYNKTHKQQEHPTRPHRLNDSRGEMAASKIWRCLTSRDDSKHNSEESFKKDKEDSTRNESRKEADEVIEEPSNNDKEKMKLLTLKDLKNSDKSNSATFLHHPARVDGVKRKSYLEKLADRAPHQ